MADISRRPFLNHLRGTPTGYVRYLRGGAVRREGVGLSFWYRPRTAVLSEVPVDDRELPLLFHARTADFQDVAVQATITYRIADPVLAATRLDFGVDPENGAWRASPLDQVAGMITETAQQYAAELLAGEPLARALVDGVAQVRDRVGSGLAGDPRLAQTGLAVVGVRVVAIRPEPEMEKALRTPTREQVQTEADRATYGRRALAVEQERRIAENELQNKIELARREEQLVVQRGANERRRTTEEAAVARIAAEAEGERLRLAADTEAERTRIEAAARAEAVRVLGAAEGDAEAAKVAALRGLDQPALVVLAVRDLAAHLPEIGALTITPDLLTQAVGRLAGVGDAAGGTAGGAAGGTAGGRA
ncbi:SPFH domain-containing protein [Frankia sp. CNm7]|uniref:SPFH domain-containing protein n=1 Tax=Frankia nepalensis TaxID=1836974 RepID=A0A937RNL4_9ACTN|nr:SPFH domain-containing protein [Frankia nepalensis]MBL7499407.1 SPFH domain-containing protein [Frankia nepalensis]MBL7509948.1 SPFH domain-containing protein [Frankia nepalensis]MBL7522713.1 SPFH domain-containing protein [Frankia nepalensis]MBL7629768.1 SPFH domain-containing protein [Frankia nepalensis]